ncbi:sensor histidine kinase [Parasulfitobacter algicola]|uniref:histidine kinase n=1 Tax=Parasulfitobacter algicola TaxID=2614809 RepID=A0ABX2IY83_9RHOB|nr:HAMP domain-containing sensor histidine kinase [Sulfitobacter algicola]NSX55408.1 HAMP domain-containing histidine kinase [Sulfitobacter algicola]
MRPLSSHLLRIGGSAALAAVIVILGLVWIGEVVLWNEFERSLPPDLLAELNKETEALSTELVDRMDAYYSGRIVGIGIAAIALVGLLTGAIVSLIGGRRLLRPLLSLSEVAGKISAGDLSARAPTVLRTTEEVERFIRDFNKMAAAAERLERERRESSAAIAHELRTPLTVLSGRLHGMLDGVFPTDRSDILALLGQVNLLTRIVEDLRLLTLSEAGRLSLTLESVDLAEVVRSQMTTANAIPNMDRTTIATDLKPAPVEGDALRIMQVLQALLWNAVHHGGGTIRVETGSNENAAWLRVMDRGPGLPADEAGRAFDRFWRADDVRGDVGSGLGLSVVQAIAKAHDAEVCYADRPGGGAIFELRFDAARTPSISTVSPQNAQTA